MKPLFHVSLTKLTLFTFLIISLSSCSKAVDMSKYQEASKVWEKEIQQLEAKDKAEMKANGGKHKGKHKAKGSKSKAEEAKTVPNDNKGQR